MTSLHPNFHCSITSKHATLHIENQIILKLWELIIKLKPLQTTPSSQFVCPISKIKLFKGNYLLSCLPYKNV